MILVLGEPDYPEPLMDLTDPPAFLFALGAITLAANRRVGIVGTRNSSASGERIAHRIAAECVRAGATVVSGMALGIDAAAHRGALQSGGGTIAVLGGGADLPYPPAHAALHERITSDGLALSEAPLGTRPVKGAFPRRNRIIAALSDVLVVVEAGHRSGALITANQALELGRPVAAVPGPIDSPRHAGSNQLLASGALFVSAPEDVLPMARLSAAPRATDSAVTKAGGTRGYHLKETKPKAEPRSPAEQAVFDAVNRGASDPDVIARITGLPACEIGSALSALELSGDLRLDPGGGIALAQ